MQSVTEAKSYAYLFLIPLAVFVLAFSFRTLWLVALVPVGFAAVGFSTLAIALWTGCALDSRWRATISKRERPLYYWTYVWIASMINLVLLFLTLLLISAL